MNESAIFLTSLVGIILVFFASALPLKNLLENKRVEEKDRIWTIVKAKTE